MNTPEVGIQIEIIEDERYFRVYLKFGTHKLHSEKLNIDTAMELSHELKIVVGEYESLIGKVKKMLEKET